MTPWPRNAPGGERISRQPQAEAVSQNHEQATYCGKLSPEDGHLDFHCSVGDLCRWVRAYNPMPGTWALAEQQRVGILALEKGPSEVNLEPGQVLGQDGRLLVGAADGSCAITMLKPAARGPWTPRASSMVTHRCSGCPKSLLTLTHGPLARP